MASVYELHIDGFNISHSVLQSYDDSADRQFQIYWAATKIQSTWRGHQARENLKLRTSAAIVIQKHTRGWLLRWRMPELLRQYYIKRTMAAYHEYATRIQTAWRAYKVRKDFGLLRDSLSKLKIMSVELFELKVPSSYFAQAPHDSLRECLDKLFNMHHLLRTKQKEGVLSIHGSNELSTIEDILRRLPFADYIRDLRSIYSKYGSFSDKPVESSQADPLTIEDSTTTGAGRDRFRVGSKVSHHFVGSLSCSEPYAKPIDKVLRKFDSSRNICDKDFDLYVYKKGKVQPKFQPLLFNNYQCNKHCGH